MTPDDKGRLGGAAVTAARRRIEAEGLAALNARALARDVGASVGTLYNAFAGIDEVIAEANVETLGALLADLRRLPAPSGDAEADLRGLADAYLRFVAAHRNLWGAVFAHRWPTAMPVPPTHAPTISALFTVIEERLGGVADGEQRAHLARALWAALHGLATLAVSGKLATVAAEDPVCLVHALITAVARRP